MAVKYKMTIMREIESDFNKCFFHMIEIKKGENNKIIGNAVKTIKERIGEVLLMIM